MADKYAGMNQEELLRELIRLQKKNNRDQKAASLFCLVIAVLFALGMLILIPRAVVIMDQANTIASEATDTIQQANAVMGQAEVTLKNVNTLVEDNMDDLNSTVRSVSEIDFESLNRSIDSLEAVTDSLSESVKSFEKVTRLFR